MRPPDQQQIVALLERALEGRAEVRVGGTTGDGMDIELRRPNGQRQLLHVKAWKGEKRESRGQVYLLRRARSALQDQLRTARQSFIDLSGVVYLDFPWLLLDRSGLRHGTSRTEARQLIDPFADRASRVARTLLLHSSRTWGVRELASQAGVSAATASEALRALEQRQLVAIERSGRSVRARSSNDWELFRAWTRVYDWKRNESLTVAAPVGDPSRYLRRLPTLLAHAPRWALTMQAGASLLAPHATWENIHIYVDAPTLAELAEVAQTAGWEQGAGGRVTLMRPWYSSSVWLDSRNVRGIMVVNPLQLMLDLWHYPVRGREAAEFIADTLLSWKPHVPT